MVLSLPLLPPGIPKKFFKKVTKAATDILMLATSALAGALAAILAPYSTVKPQIRTISTNMQSASVVSTREQSQNRNQEIWERSQINELPRKRPRRAVAIDFVPAVIAVVSPIFSLPMEIFVMIAVLMSDQDLYNLTLICHHMADIMCPLFLARRDFSLRPNGHSIRGRGFAALPIWLRWRMSPAFTPVRSLYCWLDPNSERGEIQLMHVQDAFSSLPSQTTFNTVNIHHVPVTHKSILEFLETTLRTGCSNITVSTSAPLDSHLRSMCISSSFTTLQGLEELTLRHQHFSSTHWTTLLSQLFVPLLKRLSVYGNISVSAMREFLSRHPAVRYLQFMSDCEQTLLVGGAEDPPVLEDLGGPVYHILALLQTFAAPSPLETLDVHDNKIIYPSFDMYLQTVAGCLELCKNPLCLFMTMSANFDISSVEAVRRLRCTSSWSLVQSLTIIFHHTADDLILAFCGAWIAQLPILKKVCINNYDGKNCSIREVLYDDYENLVMMS